MSQPNAQPNVRANSQPELEPESQPKLGLSVQPEHQAKIAIAQAWFARPSGQVAQDLLGCYLVRDDLTPEQAPQSRQPVRTWARIVETEAYGPNPGQPEDPAMHLYRKPTPAKAVVFGPAGFAYVYSIYGKYHCFNVVTDRADVASTILIRAVELLPRSPHAPSTPSRAIASNETSAPADPSNASERTSPDTASLDCKAGAGPSKLCIALGIDRSLSKTPVQPGQPIWLAHRLPAWQQQWDAGEIAVTQTPRIGLSRGTALPWRWYLSDSAAVSKR